MTLTGTRLLIRHILRRDRVRLPVWIVALVSLMTASAAQIASLYDTPESILGYVSSVGDNPALVMFAGPGYGFDHPNVGTILVNETSLWMAIACSLMSVFLVTRHTRAEEDSERADLVRSGVIGRHAPEAAALAVAVFANALVGFGSMVVTIGFGYPTVGSIALCASFALVGMVIAAGTLVAAQLFSTGRAVLGLSIGAVAAAFVIRGIGDISVPALSWLTPFGWGIGVRAFAQERWWAPLGLVVATIGLAVASFAVMARRDLGSGLIPERRGSDRAAGWLASPLGLVTRLQRATVIGWLVGTLVLGVVYGTVGRDIEQLLKDNPQLADYLAPPAGRLAHRRLSRDRPQHDRDGRGRVRHRLGAPPPFGGGERGVGARVDHGDQPTSLVCRSPARDLDRQLRADGGGRIRGRARVRVGDPRQLPDRTVRRGRTRRLAGGPPPRRHRLRADRVAAPVRPRRLGCAGGRGDHRDLRRDARPSGLGEGPVPVPAPGRRPRRLVPDRPLRRRARARRHRRRPRCRRAPPPRSDRELTSASGRQPPTGERRAASGKRRAASGTTADEARQDRGARASDPVGRTEHHRRWSRMTVDERESEIGALLESARQLEASAPAQASELRRRASVLAAERGHGPSDLAAHRLPRAA
ncbi:MAG: hypothetical protein R2715_01815 [Ilumatobacteraceae bacterium]